MRTLYRGYSKIEEIMPDLLYVMWRPYFRNSRFGDFLDSIYPNDIEKLENKDTTDTPLHTLTFTWKCTMKTDWDMTRWFSINTIFQNMVFPG